MRVILKESLENLGDAGEIVNVRDGYGRNYLLPRGLAIPATTGEVKKVEHERRVIAAKAAKARAELETQAGKLAAASISIARAVGEGDRLFGSVTSRDIATALEGQGLKVDARKVMLPEPIKQLGLTEVEVKLGQGLTATVKVWVVKQEN